MHFPHCNRLVRQIALTALLSCISLAANPPAQVSRGNQGIQSIQHIIFIIKENRSFDQFFGLYPGALGANTAVNSIGQTVTLGRTPDENPQDIDHSWQAAVGSINGGKMDRFDLINEANVDGQNLAFTQSTQQDIPNYWAYAQHFVLSDQTYASMTGPTFPNHLYMIAAQGGGAMNIPEGYEHNGPAKWGCDSDPGTFVQVMDPLGNVSTPFPCFDFATLADELETAKISWKYYAPSEKQSGYIFSVFDAINHIRNSPLWNEHVVTPDQFATDIQNGQLPAVSWIVQGFDDSDHPPHSLCRGESYTVNQINALMQSPYWNSSAIFLAWDDWGGFYDHYPPPPPPDQFAFGPRVPMIIISPFAKPGYISHTPYEFTSILKFIEEDFGLDPMTSRDANANDMLDSFNFNQTANPPLVLTPRMCPILCAAVTYFSDTVVGQTTSYPEIIYNQRQVDLTITNITTTGDFSAVNHCPAKVSAGASCQITLNFTPTQAGQRTGTLTVTDSDPTSPQTSTLQGNGTFGDLEPKYPGIAFPSQGVGRKGTTEKATLTNRGATALPITRIWTAGNYGQTNNCPSSLDPGASCTVSIVFNPVDSSLQYGNLAVALGNSSGTLTTRLRGYGTVAHTSGNKLNFPAISIGTTSPPEPIQLTNFGTTELTIGSITSSGDFSQTNNCGNELPVAGSCTIQVTFKPTRVGKRTGTVQIVDSDFNSPQVINLTGLGVVFAINTQR